MGIGTNTPHPSAKLEVSSNNSGFLPPRMTTTERDAIASPAVGLQIYNLTTHCLEIYDFGKWNSVYCVPIDSTTIVDSTLLTDIDGHTYPTVQICNQTWMAKNLDVARYRNGDIIPQVTDPTEWANLTTGAWCWYNNDSATYGSVYGRLYNWYAVNDPRGLAPIGWHVPSDGEWNKLVKCLDVNADTTCINCNQSAIAGGAMKEVGTSHWNSPNIGATNSSGFSALPGGLHSDNGGFYFVGVNMVLWSSTEYNSEFAMNRVMNNVNAVLVRDKGYKVGGFSIRCIKDTPITTLNDGLVAYYPFNGNANDESGNGNNGTVNGATLTTDRFGNSGKAYDFNGLTNSIVVPNSQTLNIVGNQITISYWMNFRNNIANGNYQGVSKGGWDLGSGYELIFRYSSPTGVVCLNSGYGGFNCQGIDGYQNTWVNITSTFENGTQKTYYNGILQNSISAGTGITSFNSNTNSLYIGTRDPQNGHVGFLDGKIDDIRIYNRALTQEEISYLATH